MKIDIAGGTLEFVKVEGRKYTAEFNGEPVPIRQHSIWHEVSESGRGRNKVVEEEGMTQRLGELEDIKDVKPERLGDTLVFSFEWPQQFRLNKHGRIAISLRDGVVAYEAEVWEEDGSYY